MFWFEPESEFCLTWRKVLPDAYVLALELYQKGSLKVLSEQKASARDMLISLEAIFKHEL